MRSLDDSNHGALILQATEAYRERDFLSPLIDLHALYEELAHYPQAVEAWLFLGAACVLQGDKKKATIAFQHVIDASPSLPLDGEHEDENHAAAEARCRLANILNTEEADQVTRGLHLAREAIHLAPNLAQAWRMLGYLSLVAGNYQAAVNSYERSVTLSTNAEDLRFDHNYLGLALEALGENVRAQTHYMKSKTFPGPSVGIDPEFRVRTLLAARRISAQVHQTADTSADQQQARSRSFRLTSNNEFGLLTSLLMFLGAVTLAVAVPAAGLIFATGQVRVYWQVFVASISLIVIVTLAILLILLRSRLRRNK